MKRLVWTVACGGLLLVGCAAGAGGAARAPWGGTLIRVAWAANPEPDVTTYRLYIGKAPGQYDVAVDVGRVTMTTLRLYQPGVWYLAVTARTGARESVFSSELMVRAQP